MAATVVVKECTGSASTHGTVTSLTFCTHDTRTAGDDYPLPIPSGGTVYSYWKVLFLNADATPTGTINNVKWYTDGTNNMGTGVGLLAGTGATYTAPTGTTGVGGDASTVATTNAFTYTSVAPLAVTGSLDNPDTGKISDYVYLQMSVGSTASAGSTPSEDGTFAWDET